MKGKYIGIIAFLLVIVVLIASCNLGSPDLVLRVVNPTYQIIGNDVHITFELKNTGSERLENCKVKWYVDDFDNDVLLDANIEYDEITIWAPSTGIDLGVGIKRGPFTVETTLVDFSGGVNFFGIYEMGWNYSSDE